VAEDLDQPLLYKMGTLQEST